MSLPDCEYREGTGGWCFACTLTQYFLNGRPECWTVILSELCPEGWR